MKIHFDSMHAQAVKSRAVQILPIAALAVLAAVLFAVHRPAPASAEFDGAHENSSVYYSSNANASQGNASFEAANSRNIKNSGTFYTIQAFENTVAIFEGDSTAPLYAIDTPLERLTETDRALLTAGIRTDTLAAAFKLIEDYE